MSTYSRELHTRKNLRIKMCCLFDLTMEVINKIESYRFKSFKLISILNYTYSR